MPVIINRWLIVELPSEELKETEGSKAVSQAIKQERAAHALPEN